MTLLGPDASHHQGTVDFAAVKRAGNVFTFLKATEGTGYTDPTYHANDAAARAAGLTVGAYHFASGTSPLAEADYFCSVVGALRTGDLVALDWETTSAAPATWCRAWLDRVRATLGVKPLIYMNQSTRDGHDWTPVISGDYGLWLAAYDGNQTVPSPGRWPAVAIKQFTSSGSVPGISGSCDRNVFFGDAAALAAYGYQGDNMAPTAQEIAQAVWAYNIAGKGVQAQDRLYGVDAVQLPALARGVASAQAAVAELLAKPGVSAADIAAAIPAGMAQQVVVELGKIIVAAPPA